MAAAAPSLRQFMRRREVLCLYREVNRAVRRAVPAESRAETLAFARSQFEAHRGVTDDTAVAWLVSEGRMQVERWARGTAMATG